VNDRIAFQARDIRPSRQRLGDLAAAFHRMAFTM
jgi:hypothetical protein